MLLPAKLQHGGVNTWNTVALRVGALLPFQRWLAYPTVSLSSATTAHLTPHPARRHTPACRLAAAPVPPTASTTPAAGPRAPPSPRCAL